MILEKVLWVAALWGQPFLAAKPSRGQIWMGWLAPYSGLGPTIVEMKGQGYLPGSILSRRARAGGGTSLGDAQTPALDACAKLAA
jgi:hypothetical protein